ncbi:MAG: AraC family transcriptional regulator [Eubacteriales bacterium]|nr:AraC family transcriptional regulator [Eubacteriales bacterium]
MPSLRFHESLQRGSPDFPLEYYLLDQHHARYEMSFHWHEEVELLRIRSGAFTLSLEDQILRLLPGDMAFIPSGCLHGGVPEDAVYECVVFDMRFLLKAGEACRTYILDVLHRQVTVSPLLSKGSPAARVLSSAFDALHSRTPGYEAITVGALLQFIGCIFQDGLYTPGGSADDCRKVLQLKKVFELIESDYAAPLTLAQLAACANMTPKYFCRFFKQAVHRSPMDYLNFYRIEMACYALAATDCNVTEAALDAGFNDPGYFIRTFKHFKGETPGHYAARIRRIA